MTSPRPVPASPSGAAPLVALLTRCVARVDCDGGFRGSGFFVTPTEVLTCAHVIHGGGAVSMAADLADEADEAITRCAEASTSWDRRSRAVHLTELTAIRPDLASGLARLRSIMAASERNLSSVSLIRDEDAVPEVAELPEQQRPGDRLRELDPEAQARP